MSKPDSSEVDCYDIILNYYQNTKDSPIQKEIWKNKVYLRLMEMWEKGERDKEDIKNLFILVLNLFGEDIPPDIYNTIGSQMEKVKNRKKIKSILSKEFS
jgi:hypothetical protein